MSINVGQQASDFLVCDWLMMSSTNGGFERRKNRLVLLDEFPDHGHTPHIIVRAVRLRRMEERLCGGCRLRLFVGETMTDRGAREVVT